MFKSFSLLLTPLRELARRSDPSIATAFANIKDDVEYVPKRKSQRLAQSRPWRLTKILSVKKEVEVEDDRHDDGDTAFGRSSCTVGEAGTSDYETSGGRYRGPGLKTEEDDMPEPSIFCGVPSVFCFSSSPTTPTVGSPASRRNSESKSSSASKITCILL